ncbi:MAG: glycosyl hydrolase 108 family protein [Pseudomonadota bacterium]
MTDRFARQTSIASLHPEIRKPVSDILRKLHSEGLPFEVFEAWRTPELQEQYYFKGRDRFGNTVDKTSVITHAKPWQSFHQYGLAVDLVLKDGRTWSWDDKGDNAQKWNRMHEVAREHGMVPLAFEKPHLQIASVKTSNQLRNGDYPAGGDDAWVGKLKSEIALWSGTPAAPPLPDEAIKRPAFKTSGPQKPEHPTTRVLTGEEAYARIIAKIFELEGGYADHPADPGGPTNMGITLKTLEDWRGSKLSASDVRQLTKNEAAEIYRRGYFEKCRCGQMPAAVALHVFNTAVMSGPVRAGEIIQRALNTLNRPVEIDGKIGPKTLEAILSLSQTDLSQAHHDVYLSYLKNLPHWQTFGKGWGKRMKTIGTLAHLLASGTEQAETLAEAQTEMTDGHTGKRVRVYLIKGLLGDIFSTGFDRLGAKLTAQGHEASVHHWNDRKQIEADILKTGERATTIKRALIGHSLGANTALRLVKSLSARGVHIDYLATLDATINRRADGAEKADNFRSNDIRDRPVGGAREIIRADLNHIQIDKDDQIHRRIIANCNALIAATPDAREAPVPDVGETHDEIMEILTLLSKNGRSGMIHNEPPLTPVNALLGNGRIGRFLDGKKTAIGGIGLLATQILPVVFPSVAPLVDLLEKSGLPVSDPEAGKTVLTSIFAALTVWGGLGKLEKWAEKLSMEISGSHQATSEPFPDRATMLQSRPAQTLQ